MKNRVIINISEEIKNKVVSRYKKYEKVNNNEYISFFAEKDGLQVTVYSSKKATSFKAQFVGEEALKEAQIFDSTAVVAEQKEKKNPTKATWEILDDQIGSDEVGTGDFFGPICVCAAYVSSKDITKLKALGVDDSKRLNDEQIKELGKKLIKIIDYSQVSLDNIKYNELIDKNMNMNEMKSKLHNRVLLNLKKKHKKVSNVLIDQFVKESSYYSYLFGEKEIVENITFKTKGETYFPSVAVGSIIARYSFLQKMEAMSKKYKMEIPFGASTKVTEFAKKFVKKYGLNELNKIVKKNFANYNDLAK